MIVLSVSTAYALLAIVNETLVFSFFELLDQLGQWSKFSLINQVELVDEINEMLETCVQMCFSTQEHDVLEMGVIDMCINSKKSLEDDLNDVHEILRKWDS